jgi:hypothetical protein
MPKADDRLVFDLQALLKRMADPAGKNYRIAAKSSARVVRACSNFVLAARVIWSKSANLQEA